MVTQHVAITFGLNDKAIMTCTQTIIQTIDLKKLSSPMQKNFIPHKQLDFLDRYVASGVPLYDKVFSDGRLQIQVIESLMQDYTRLADELE